MSRLNTVQAPSKWQKVHTAVRGDSQMIGSDASIKFLYNGLCVLRSQSTAVMAAISNTNNIFAPFGNDGSFNRSTFLFALFGYEIFSQISLKRQMLE